MTLHFSKILQQLDTQNRLRTLKPACGIDLTSNDYLGLSTHPALKNAALAAIEGGLPMGAGGSRLLRGQTPAHAALEDFAAAYFSCEKTLFFPTGFLANLALFAALPDRNDLIFYDSLAHASMRDGIRASQARGFKIPHNDVQAFEAALQQHARQGRTLWIAVESVYSMDGDLAPLSDLMALADKYNAFLVVDEAHATGLYGVSGKGLTEGVMSERLITLHTCGKALGVAGGLVCAAAPVIDMLINRARPFIYSTAPPPLQALLVQAALQILQDEPWRRERLWQLRDRTNQLLGTQSPSQIIPIILGGEEKTMKVARALQQAGFDVRAIRPPSVPAGTSRLRISLNIGLDEKILGDFANHLHAVLQRGAA